MRLVTPLALASLLLANAPAWAEGGALVTTQAPRRGTAPEIVTAYGSAAPSTFALQSLTLAQTGQVTAVAVTAGQTVRKGQALLSFAVAPSALASYRQAQTALTLAQTQRAHTAVLLGQQLATRDQLAVADKAVADARTQIVALARDGAAQATTTLKAPFDGVVTAVPVSSGDRPAAGAALVTLARSGGLQVSVGVEPGRRGQVRVGQPVRLEPLGGGPAVSGRVVRIDSALNPRTRQVDVDVSVPAGAALSGQSFRAEIAVGGRTGWLAPHGAVRVEDGAAFVFQLTGTKAHRVDVRVVQPGRDVDVIDGPLDPARPLVVVGAYQLDDGAAVRRAR